MCPFTDSVTLMKNNKLLNWFLSPFSNRGGYLILLLLLLSYPNIKLQIVQGGYVYAAYVFLLYFLISYILVLLIGFNARIFRWLRFVLVSVATVFLLISQIVYHIFASAINSDILSIVSTTNIYEIKEFFCTYITMPITGVSFLILSLVFILWRLSERYSLRFVKLGLCTLLLSVASVIHNPCVCQTIVGEGKWSLKLDEVVDLRSCHHDFDIIGNIQGMPHTVVVILGESHSKSHSQLYGSKSNNQPILSEFQNRGSLCVWTNVISPACYTTEAFRYILNTNRPEQPIKHYNAIAISEVFQKLGYHTFWISNQLEIGMHDNIPASYGHICDESYFVGTDYSNHDGEVLPILHSLQLHDYNLIFVHLMGQHEQYQQRYPSSYDCFHPNDYLDYPEHQRSIRAEYDNAILYNDFVVSSVFKYLDGKDGIGLYFSDHGVDVFDTEDNFHGHAKGTKESQRIGKEVPFYVYSTEEFRTVHDVVWQRLLASKDQPFCISNFIFMLMDLFQCSFADDACIKYSPLIQVYDD